LEEKTITLTVAEAREIANTLAESTGAATARAFVFLEQKIIKAMEDEA